MSKVLKLKNNEDANMVIDSCFNGLNIGLVSVHDSATANPSIIDPSLISVKLRNLVTKKMLFDGSLLEMWAFFHRGETSLNSHISSTSIPLSGNMKLQDYSLKFPALHGQYEVRIQTKNAFPANHKQDSYLVLTNDYCSESVLLEWSLEDATIDRKSDSFYSPKCASAVIIDVAKANSRTASSVYNSSITQVALSSSTESWARDTEMLTVQAGSFCEEPHSLLFPMSIIHDEEILINSSFEVNTTDVSNQKIFILHITPLPVAIAIASADYEAKEEAKVFASND